MAKPLQFEDAVIRAKSVHGNRYEYLRLDRVKGKVHIEYMCKLHGECSQEIHRHFAGAGCFRCGVEARSKANIFSLGEVKAKASKVHGDKYEYIRVEGGKSEGKRRSIVHYICPDHGEQFQALTHHLAGHGCKTCGSIRGAEARNAIFKNPTPGGAPVTYFESFKFRATEVHQNRYIYLSMFQKDGVRCVKYLCPIHGERVQSAGNHLAGKGCRSCAVVSTGILRRTNFDDYITKASNVHSNIYTYEKLDYSRSKSDIHYSCKSHGKIVQDAQSHLAGFGCARCGTFRVSKGQIQIAEFLEGLGVKVELEYRFPADRRFCDIVSHEHKLAIEYNGTYWHSSEYLPNDYHLLKSKLAEDNGYRCIHICSSEWEGNRHCVEMLLRAATGNINTKIYARKASLSAISSERASSFLTRNHIQGSAIGESVGLMYAGELCAVMTFSYNTSVRSQKASSGCVELVRYATSTSVVGGFSKLLKYFLNLNPAVRQVVSYSDVRMFTGQVYELAGFTKQHTTRPDYKYLEGVKLWHKSRYQKSRLLARFGAEAVKDKTEKEITEEQGIYRIYDCGKTKWLYTR